MKSSGRKGWGEVLKNAAGGLLVAGVLFLAFAPDSVWQGGGVTPEGERRAGDGLDLPDLGGAVWRLDERRGRVVLINYWATWCPPCRAETPGLVRLAEEYGPRGLEVVGVSLDEDRAAIRPFVEEYRVPYPILLPPDLGSLRPAVEALPTTVLYDRGGRVAKRYTGAVSESTFRADVESLLAEDPD
jgi:thiol-disulfide isomerase/thioredoxin